MVSILIKKLMLIHYTIKFKSEIIKVSIIGGTEPQGLGIGKRLAIAGVDIIIASHKRRKGFEHC